jgi:hypothetical protein
VAEYVGPDCVLVGQLGGFWSSPFPELTDVVVLDVIVVLDIIVVLDVIVGGVPPTPPGAVVGVAVDDKALDERAEQRLAIFARLE